PRMEVIRNRYEVEPCVFRQPRVVDQRARRVFFARKCVSELDHVSALPTRGTAQCVKVVYERRLPRSPSALQFVRHDVESALAGEHVPRPIVDDALLVLSELGTNAMHAVGYEEEIDVRLGVERSGDVIVEVEDPG